MFADDLAAGDVLSLPEGRTACVVTIRHERAVAGSTFTTYNFEVEETHTYFVGRHGAWVHNASSRVCIEAADRFHNRVGLHPPAPTEHAVEKLREDLLALGSTDIDRDYADALGELVRKKQISEELRQQALKEANIAPVQPTITFGHGGRHLKGTGLLEATVERAIAKTLHAVSPVGSHWGWLKVEGQWIEYRAHILPDGTVHIGTYFPVSGPLTNK